MRAWHTYSRVFFAGVSLVWGAVAVLLGRPEWTTAAITCALLFITWQYTALFAQDLKLKERPFLVPDPGDILVIPQLQENVSRNIADAVVRVFNSGSATAPDVCYHSRFLNAPEKRATFIGPHAVRPGTRSTREFQMLSISGEGQPEPGCWSLLVLIGFASPSGDCYAVPCHLGSGDGGWLVDQIRDLGRLADLRDLPTELERLADGIQSKTPGGGRRGPGPQLLERSPIFTSRTRRVEGPLGLSS